MQANQKPIYTHDLGGLKDQVNTMQNQMNTVMEERNILEAAFCLYYTELAEAYNVANALVHATPAAALTPMITIDKMPFPYKFNSTRIKLWAFTTQLQLKVISLPDKQSRLRLVINYLPEESMDQVQQYIKADHIDLKNVKPLIDILEEEFRKPNRMAKVESKLYNLQ